MEERNNEEVMDQEQTVDTGSSVGGILQRIMEQPRGLFRIPEVTLTPIDVRDYLPKKSEPLNGLTNHSEPTNTTFTIHNFKPKEFSISLIRDDLEALKDRLKYSYLTVCCKICKKRYSTTKKLRKHEEAKHMFVMKPQKRVSFSDKVIIHELKEYHKCRKCTRIFEEYEHLRNHMRKDHRKRKCYICFYCTKSFVDRSIFKLHIKSHCNACGEFFSKRCDYLEHRREVCKITKKYKCKTCKDIYFQRMDLRDHSYEHLGTFFICDICKDQFSTKCEVTHHITYLHSYQPSKNLYEETGLDTQIKYHCNSCNKMSSEKAIMEDHTQVLPNLTNEAKSNYEDYYFCQNCLKKFMSKSALEEHRKGHVKLKSNKHVNIPLDKTVADNNDNYEVRTFNCKTDLPPLKFPKIVLERLTDSVTDELKNDSLADIAEFGYAVPLLNFDSELPKKAVVDKRKTLYSRYRCELCNKHLYNSYTLRRHRQTVHPSDQDLQCPVCEETFANRLLLQSHRCIRQYVPETETSFDDARPEIYFDNMMLVYPPEVQLTEFDEAFEPDSPAHGDAGGKRVLNDWAIDVQEVPIEF